MNKITWFKKIPAKDLINSYTMNMCSPAKQVRACIIKLLLGMQMLPAS